jgi:LAO/AO transport system kinase
MDGGSAKYLTDLVERVLVGDTGALARAITIAENRLEGWQLLLSRIHPKLGRAVVVGVTGPPGVGKSTLVNEFTKEQRRRNRTVGVLAIDPSSPISGGAVLGDRIRMTDSSLDNGVFIRSASSRGRLGGLSPAVGHMVDLMDASGRDVVVLETVGTGQSEVEVADLADTTIVVCAPGLGDDVQAIKAGILEVGDVLVVNKSDQAQARQTEQQLRAMLMLRRGPRADIEVVKTIATSGVGVAELVNAVDRHVAGSGQAEHRIARREHRLQRLIIESAMDDIRARCGGNEELIASLAKAVRCGESDVDAASESLVRLLLSGNR